MNEQAVAGVRQFLEALGIDLAREGMEETPARVATLFAELFRGYGTDTASLWNDLYETDYHGIVSITGIPFYSVCEHHLMPFFGTVDIAYLPEEGRVPGLGRLPKLVDRLSRRPQLQERLVKQIADALEHELGATGVLVRMTSTQLCMLMKGELSPATQVSTLETRGVFQAEGRWRQEALAVIGGDKDV